MINIFDMMGPVMVGPSSSHTAGAARIGKITRMLLGSRPVSARIGLYGSFQKTYLGLGTDKALIGGLLGSGEGSGVTIRNCVSQVDISVSFVNDQKAQRAAVGGLVGRLSGSGSHEITNCRNEGRI